MYKVNLTVRIFNHGGYPVDFKEAQLAGIAEAERNGEMSSEEANKARVHTELMTQPVKEQFRFIKTVELPFPPIHRTTIRVGEGDDTFFFQFSEPVWNMETQEFDCDMYTKLCLDCEHDGCFIGVLRRSWDWTPVPAGEDEDAESEEGQVADEYDSE